MYYNILCCPAPYLAYLYKHDVIVILLPTEYTKHRICEL